MMRRRAFGNKNNNLLVGSQGCTTACANTFFRPTQHPNPTITVVSSLSPCGNIKTEAELYEQVMLFVRSQTLKQIIFMTPTALIPHTNRYMVHTIAGTDGFIRTGHIHSGCTDAFGNLNPAGDVSFSNTLEILTNHVFNVADSRLTGYMPFNSHIYRGEYTSNQHEIENWCEKAARNPKLPIYMMSIPFTNKLHYDRYLKLANVSVSKRREYSLLTYSDPSTHEIRPPSNCVAVIRELTENFYNMTLDLGQNPSPQATFLQLASHLGAVKPMPIMQLEEHDELAIVHRESKKSNYVI